MLGTSETSSSPRPHHTPESSIMLAIGLLNVLDFLLNHIPSHGVPFDEDRDCAQRIRPRSRQQPHRRYIISNRLWLLFCIVLSILSSQVKLWCNRFRHHIPSNGPRKTWYKQLMNNIITALAAVHLQYMLCAKISSIILGRCPRPFLPETSSRPDSGRTSSFFHARVADTRSSQF